MCTPPVDVQVNVPSRGVRFKPDFKVTLDCLRLDASHIAKSQAAPKSWIYIS
ncbi:hypothetical protein Ciccas_005206, partial [Cichlidogyrus casuarinus]